NVGGGNDLTPAITTHGALPAGRGSTQAVVHNGYVYLVGGFSATNTTIYAEILSTDTLGAWQTATALLPANRFDGGVAAFNNTIYQIGGAISGNTDAQSTVFRAVFGAAGDISSWEADNPLVGVTGVRRV